MIAGKVFVQARDKVVQRHVAQGAIDLACEAYGVNPVELLPSGRAPANVSLTRQVAIYLAHVVGQLSISQLSQEFERDRSTISHSCRIIEDRMSSPHVMYQFLIEFLAQVVSF